jgi:hypothetical protein
MAISEIDDVLRRYRAAISRIGNLRAFTRATISALRLTRSIMPRPYSGPAPAGLFYTWLLRHYTELEGWRVRSMREQETTRSMRIGHRLGRKRHKCALVCMADPSQTRSSVVGGPLFVPPLEPIYACVVTVVAIPY